MKSISPLKVLFVLGVGLLAACTTPQATATPENPLNLYVPRINATGVIVPKQYTSLSVTVPGVVETVFVKEGDLVEAGQLLLEMKG